MTQSQKTLSKLTITTIFLLCFLPVIFAWILYFNKDHLRLKSTAHGTLLQPPLSLQFLPIPPPITQTLKGHWILMRVSQARCEQDCQRSLYFMRQIHIATGKDSERIRRLWLSVAPVPTHLTTTYPPILTSSLASPQYLHFMNTVSRVDKTNIIQQPAIFIVDPLGNIILRYPENAKGGDILADLKKLLGVSNIG